MNNSSVKVVHLKKEPYDVRIDRTTKWGNPFTIGKEGTRDDVISKYEAYMMGRPDLIQALPELEGKTLGCWCKQTKEEFFMFSEEEAKHMCLDDYIEYMLETGKYTFNGSTKSIIGPSGKILILNKNEAGYLTLKMVFNRKVVREVYYHRLVALIYFGKDAIFNKQVAHLDGDKINNDPDNLKPMIAKDHIYYDGTYKNLVHGKCKNSWPPCVRCSNPNGLIQGGKTPDRIAGKKFGFDGELCRTCYHSLDMKDRRKKEACHGDILKIMVEDKIWLK